MAQVLCKVLLDVSQESSGVVIAAKKGDERSRVLCVQLCSCGEAVLADPNDQAYLRILKGEEMRTYQGAVTQDGELMFTIPRFAVSEVGEVSCEVAIFGDGSRLTSASFVIQTLDSLVNENFVDEGITGGTQSVLTFSQPTVIDANGRITLELESNKVYTADLSAAAFFDGSAWKEIFIDAKAPTDLTRENRIRLYGVAPVKSVEQILTLQLGSDTVCENGDLPSIGSDHFLLELDYQPLSKKWMASCRAYC